jgi:hypothetical protein
MEESMQNYNNLRLISLKIIILGFFLFYSSILVFASDDLSGKKLKCERFITNYMGDTYTINFINDKKYEIIYFKIDGDSFQRQIYWSTSFATDQARRKINNSRMKGEITVKEYREAIENIEVDLNNYSFTINRVTMTNFRKLRAENGSQFENSYIFLDRRTLVTDSGDSCKLFNGSKEELFNSTKEIWEENVRVRNLIDGSNEQQMRERNKL